MPFQCRAGSPLPDGRVDLYASASRYTIPGSAVGLGRGEADSIFIGCRLAGHNGSSEGVRNEESEFHPDIFVCGPPRLARPELFGKRQDLG